MRGKARTAARSFAFLVAVLSCSVMAITPLSRSGSFASTAASAACECKLPVSRDGLPRATQMRTGCVESLSPQLSLSLSATGWRPLPFAHEQLHPDFLAPMMFRLPRGSPWNCMTESPASARPQFWTGLSRTTHEKVYPRTVSATHPPPQNRSLASAAASCLSQHPVRPPPPHAPAHSSSASIRLGPRPLPSAALSSASNPPTVSADPADTPNPSDRRTQSVGGSSRSVRRRVVGPLTPESMWREGENDRE